MFAVHYYVPTETMLTFVEPEMSCWLGLIEQVLMFIRTCTQISLSLQYKQIDPMHRSLCILILKDGCAILLFSVGIT